MCAILLFMFNVGASAVIHVVYIGRIIAHNSVYLSNSTRSVYMLTHTAGTIIWFITIMEVFAV